MKLLRTNAQNQDFIYLVKQLDQYLKIVDGEDHEFYNQYNGVGALKNVIICYLDDQPVGCGAFKPYNENTVELKRMFVLPEARGKGIGGKILIELENWASELNFSKTILETGRRQIEAVALYEKHKYSKIPNYGQYKEMENSLCFEKVL